MISPTTDTVPAHALSVPGARLHYELRGAGPLVALVGSPMDAASFAPLATLLATGHTVLTTDPRGINRSPVTDPDSESTPELRADDLSLLLAHLDAGPAAVLGSSGGAATVLALAQAHPEQVHTVIAHEPPLAQLLPDRQALLSATDDMIATYLRGDIIAAWRKFMRTANIELPAGMLEMMFGPDRDARQLADERRWFARELRATNGWQPDLAALRTASPRIIVGIGTDSAGQLCDRASRALAAELGVEPTMFSGGHTAFTENPERFAAELRAVLGDD
ncbi:alpha/beta fold hydrolase [Amycolatopsis sp. cg5]|uniref:alpha/beta fold hydrolase n=1 Tax=Amycolatopsis sp. cg5 TaxID=3238802 RepID=UPI003526339A